MYHRAGNPRHWRSGKCDADSFLLHKLITYILRIDIITQNHHCILDVCISAVERLQRLQIYPIVLLLRFKSAKQIKEIKDSRYSTEKISAKAAKEMYEHTLKLESDYRQYISGELAAADFCNGMFVINQICSYLLSVQP